MLNRSTRPARLTSTATATALVLLAALLLPMCLLSVWVKAVVTDTDRYVATVGSWLPVVWVGLVALALVLARGRRRGTLRLMACTALVHPRQGSGVLGSGILTAAMFLIVAVALVWLV